jgi:hypothetical protein
VIRRPAPGAEAADTAGSTGFASARDAATADPDHDRRRRSPAKTLGSYLYPVSLGVALLPIVVAVVRAIARGWIPTGDNAFFPIRARDVLTHDHLPLLGVWSSASLTSGFDFNHPGPLLFDLGALPVGLFGGSVGTVVAIALINGLSVAGIAIFAYRRGGPLLGTLAMAVTATLCWTMGSEVLYEPWNPHSVLLPFLFFLVLVWSVTCGDLLALPFAAGVGSLVVESHLSYVLLVPVLGLVCVLGLVVFLRVDRRRDTKDSHAPRKGLWYGAIAGVVLVVCWIQPLIEQFTSDGDGNLTLLLRSARESRAPTGGYGFGVEAVVSVVALPPWWFRPSFSNTFKPGWDAPSLTTALAALFTLAVVLGACAMFAIRRRDTVSLSALAVTGVALLLGVVTASTLPETVFAPGSSRTWRVPAQRGSTCSHCSCRAKST